MDKEKKKKFNSILNALKSYRCQYTIDEFESGLPLIDVLSPGKTIKEGKEEIYLLAAHLYCEVIERNESPLPYLDASY